MLREAQGESRHEFAQKTIVDPAHDAALAQMRMDRRLLDRQHRRVRRAVLIVRSNARFGNIANVE